MPMLAAEIASTTAKPSMTFARKRRVGSLSDIDRGQTRPNNPTSTPRLLSKASRTRERKLPGPPPKIRAEWIRRRKFGPGFPSRAARLLCRVSKDQATSWFETAAHPPVTQAAYTCTPAAPHPEEHVQPH